MARPLLNVAPFAATLDAVLGVCAAPREAAAAASAGTAHVTSSSAREDAMDAQVVRRAFEHMHRLLRRVPTLGYAVDGGVARLLGGSITRLIRNGPADTCVEALMVLETALETTALLDATANGTAASSAVSSTAEPADEDDDAGLNLVIALNGWTQALVRQLQQPTWRSASASSGGGGSALQDRLAKWGQVTASEGSEASRALLPLLLRCWGRSERLLLEQALTTSSDDASQREGALRCAGAAWRVGTAESFYVAGAQGAADRSLRRGVPAAYVLAFLEPCTSSDLNLERQIVGAFLGAQEGAFLLPPRLEELERVWWLALIEPRLTEVPPKLSRQLKGLAARHSFLAQQSPLLGALAAASAIPLGHAAFGEQRSGLLMRTLEHLASTLQPAPEGAAPSAQLKLQLERHERVLKKMAQLLPRLVEEAVGVASYGNQRQSVAIGGNQPRLVEEAVGVASYNQVQSSAIKCNQVQSSAIKCNQAQSSAVGVHSYGAALGPSSALPTHAAIGSGRAGAGGGAGGGGRGGGGRGGGGGGRGGAVPAGTVPALPQPSTVPETAKKYTDLAVRVAGLLLARLPWVLCSGSGVMLDTLVTFLLQTRHAPHAQARVHASIDGVLGGLLRIARHHEGKFQLNAKKLASEFLFLENGHGGPAAHGGGGGGAAGGTEGKRHFLAALAKPRRHALRQLLLTALLLPRCLLPPPSPVARSFSELCNCASAVLGSLKTLKELLEAMKLAASGSLETADASTLVSRVLPALAHGTLRCVGLSGPECVLASQLRSVTFAVLELPVGNAAAPSAPPRSVLQLLVSEHAARAALLLQALGHAYLFRAHAALAAEARHPAERSEVWGLATADPLNIDLVHTSTLVHKEWAAPPLPPAWPKVVAMPFPEATQPMLQSELHNSVPMLLRAWSAVQNGDQLLMIGKCVDALVVNANTSKLRRAGVLHDLQKFWLETAAPEAMAIIARIKQTRVAM